MIKRIVAGLFFWVVCLSAFAQNDYNTVNRLASQAKANEEWDKAREYYEQLYDQRAREDAFINLYDIYLKLEEYKEAEKLTKKHSRRNDDPRYDIYLGYIYEYQQEADKAEEYFDEVIKDFEGEINQARILANQFMQFKLYNYAEQVYLKSQKKNKNDQLFRMELANVYALQGKTEEMVVKYLEVLHHNPSYIQTVQNIFQRVLHPDPEGSQMEMLRENVLRAVQAHPDSDILAELLIWLYIQEENFRGALLQAKALDRRSNENGKRLFNLGNLATANKQYVVAAEAFNYVISLGDQSPYYLKSRMQLVEVKKEQVFDAHKPTEAELTELENLYQKTIQELGRSAYTLDMIKGLANLKAYHLGKIDESVNMLLQAIEMNGISPQDKARLKIELADVMLLQGEVWEASLLYSQVEKEFKYDQLGETAKFKNAKVFFYTGDFGWAQAQLDVLKGSTSKLIANDAMDLSLLITDNVGRDSIQEPLQLFARADLLIFKKDYEMALKVMDTIPKFYPSTSLKDDILFKKYEIAMANYQFEKAAGHLRALIADYSYDILADDALFYLAQLNEEKLDNEARAMELYKQLLTNYPASLFVVESRKRFRSLRGDELGGPEEEQHP
jgi:tetratricopeptide (TPR) repeat protein